MRRSHHVEACQEVSIARGRRVRLFELKEGEITSYRFYLLSPGDPSTLAKPHTAIQLLLGASGPDLTPEQATSPVDEAAALLTWDTLLNSLRLRPGAL
jgi:hypothetical protein